MKRLFATVFALVAAVWLATSAFAQDRLAPLPAFVWDQVNWRNANTAGVTRSGFIEPDSSSATGSAARADTTAWVDLSNAWFPQNPGTASTDSLLFGAFKIAFGSDITVDADSIYLVAQVSNDQSTVITMTPTIAFQAANTVNATEVGAFVLSQGGTGSSAIGFVKPYKLRYLVGALGIPNGGTPSDYEMVGYRYVRWIVGYGANKKTNRAFAYFGHWTTRS